MKLHLLPITWQFRGDRPTELGDRAVEKEMKRNNISSKT